MPKSSRTESRRGAKAIAIEPERGLLLRVLLHSPKDTFAAAVALAGVASILVNALFLQAGRHPSPMFGATIALPKFTAQPPATSVPAQSEPAANASPSVQPVPPITSPLPRPRPVDAANRSADPLGSLVRSTSVVTSGSDNMQRTAAPSAQSAPATTQSIAADPVAGLIVSSQRVAAVQRALTDYGYGQIKATGTVGSDTQAAIQKFERERKLPITGLMSEQLIRELTAATGRSFD